MASQVVKCFKDIPGPRVYPIVGNALNYSKFGEFSFERAHEARRINYARYGSIYREKLGAGYFVQIYDPKDMATLFQSDGKYPYRPPLPLTVAAHKRDGFPLGLGAVNGEEWRSLRSPFQRVMMSPRAGDPFLDAQGAVADDFLEIIERVRDKVTGEVPDLDELILRYTMESIGTVCYNRRLGVLGVSDVMPQDGIDMLNATKDLFSALQLTLFSFPWFSLFRTKLYRQYVSSLQTCYRITDRHMATTESACPFTTGTGSEKEAIPTSDSKKETESANLLQTLLASGRVTRKAAIEITNDLFTAGIDSTGNALGFVLLNLAMNPEKQDILNAELSENLPSSGGFPEGVFDGTPYLKACMKESFRVNFPVNGGTIRIVKKDLVLSDYHVPKGTMVATNNQTACLDAKYFDNPNEFWPERWLKHSPDGGRVKSPSPYIMLPFGFGPRMCLGRRFAEQEIYLALAKIIPRFRLEYHHEPVGMLNRIFTAPDKPLRISFFPRT